MKVKTYVFDDIKEGMAKIRDQYGPDTIIVDIKNNAASALRKNCEISVAVEEEQEVFEEDSTEIRKRMEEVWTRTTKVFFDRIAGMESEVIKDRMKSYPLTLRIIFDKMLKNGLDTQIALGIVSEVYGEVGMIADNSVKANYFLKQAMMSRFKVTDIAGSNEPVLILGPTGSGKTQTTKKIANLLSTREVPVSVVAYDPIRKGSCEELMSFSESRGIPFSFVTDEEDLFFIIEKDRRKKIIDITGYLAMQKRVVDRLKNVKKIILLPAGARDDKVKSYISEFDDSNTIGLIFTKLDEEDTLGHICNNAVYTEKPLCFMTTGINTDDILIPDHETFYKILLEGNVWKTRERRPSL